MIRQKRNPLLCADIFAATYHKGERLAFLVGESKEKRIAVKENAVEIYRHRSGFIHHGRSIKDLGVLSTFMLNAWTCFNFLLVNMDRYQTKDQLIDWLEDRKMA
jgi:hypothetical protein